VLVHEHDIDSIERIVGWIGKQMAEYFLLGGGKNTYLDRSSIMYIARNHRCVKLVGGLGACWRLNGI